MIQLYPISLVIIALSALLSFLEVYKAELSFLLRLKRMLDRKERTRTILFYIILLVAVLTLLFPLYPGPAVLGDLLVSITLIYSAFFIKKSGEVDVVIDGDFFSNKYFRSGFFFSLVFALHLLFPTFIIL